MLSFHSRRKGQFGSNYLPDINVSPKTWLDAWQLVALLLIWACTATVYAEQETNACIDMAAQHYNIHKEILNAILSVEGGRTGMKKRNSNGSYDMGPMQINSSWLPELRRRGISEYEVANDYCTNILVGTWILARELRRAGIPPINTGEFWQTIGRYNSRDPYFSSRYAVRVWHQARYMQLSR
jgi:soluble lytic murein transglycosylase-like protein